MRFYFAITLLALSGAALSAQAGLRLGIRVVGADHEPLAGSEIIRTMSWRSGGSPESLLSGRQFPLPHVLSRAKTGADGRCQLLLPSATTSAFMPAKSVLFVRAPRHAIRAVPVHRDDMPAGPQLTIAVRERADSGKIRVRLPDGKPAVGLPVRAIGIVCGEGIALLPDELVEEQKSDSRGEVRFEHIEGVATIEIRHPTLGRQVATKAWDRGLEDVRLKATAPLRLSVAGANASVVAGMRMRIWTVARSGREAAPFSERQVIGYTEAVFDEAGRIECDALARGRVNLDLLGAADAEWVPELRWNIQHTAEGGPIELELKKTRLLSGRVVDAEKKTGIEGVELRAPLGSAVRFAKTGADGRFQIRVFGSSILLRVVYCPARYRSIPSGFGTLVKPDVESLDPIELQLGEVVEGRVVGEDGKGVAGAFVSCTWKEKTTYREATRKRSTFTAEDGRFRVAGVSPGVKPTLTARSTDAKTVTKTATGDAPITLRLEATSVVLVAGRITTRSNAPVAGAVLTLESQTVPTGRVVSSARHATTSIVATSGADGRFQCRAPAGPDYRIRIRARGFAESGSAWRRAVNGRVKIDASLRRLMPFDGKVIRGTTPVVDATISCPARGVDSQTDSGGAFRLEGLPEGTALVVVKVADGYSVHRIEPFATIDLSRKRKRRIAPEISLENRLAMAKNVLQPTIRDLEKSGKLDSNLRLWQLLASVDPAATLARIETQGLQQGFYDAAVRRSLIIAAETQSLEEALALCETLKGDDRRALNLARLATGRDPATTRRILFEALLSARRVAAPGMRLCVLARIGEGFLDAGDNATALAVFEEAEPIVAQLPNKEWPGYARACFATNTAVLDLTRSLKIVEGMNQMDRDRHHANIAHEIAAKDPEGAERVLGLLSPHALGWAAIRVCHRMVTTDTARARKIAGRIRDVGSKAYAFAAMAAALRSEELVDAALAVLDGPQGREAPAQIAAGMLHFAAQAAPDRVPDVIGRVFALRASRSTDPRLAWQRTLEADCEIAMHLALFDLELARAVLDEAIDSRDYLLSDRNKYRPHRFFTALALVEPRLAVQVVEEIAADHPQPSFRLRPLMRQTVALTLACRTPEQLRARFVRIGVFPNLEEDQ